MKNGSGTESTGIADESQWVWLGPLILLGVFSGLAYWSWDKWMDPHIDFGNELYTAWQLSEGRALYADIASKNGPLSHYWNALLFSVFGISIRTLVVFNLAVLAGICALLYRLLRRGCDRPSATLAVGFLLCVFAFGQYAPIANFNYATPYQHAQTHSLALSLVMIAALAAAHRSGATRVESLSLALAGICLGLVFLGKAELFVPAAGTAAFGLTAIVVRQRASNSHALRSIAIFVGASVAPVFIAGALLLAIMPAAVAWRGLLGNWSHMGTSLVDDAFYLTGSGFNAPAANLRAALLSFVALLLFAATVALTDRLLPAVRRRRWLCIGVATVGIGLVAWSRVRIPFDEVARALPITSALLGLALWLPAVRRRMGLWRDAESWLPLALLSVYATTLLGKMLLNAQIPHYGFVLAMPSTLLLITSLCWLLPRSLERGYGGGGLARALCVATVICAALFFLRSSQFHYRQRTFELGRNGDIIKVEARRYSIRGYVLDETMGRLEEIMDPDDTLLVLPEGASLNYWLRRTNPTPYSLFLPTEFAAFDKRGEMLRSLEEHPPDFVVLLHRENSEFGVGPFGQDPANGLAMMQWISRRYEFVVRVGAAPFSGNGFGSVILKRRSIPPAQSRSQIP